MRANVFVVVIALALFLTTETGLSAKPELKKVTRIETVTAVLKHGKLVVHVEGMATTTALLPMGGELLRHSADHQPNKDGLLEYDLCFSPPRKNPGDKLKPVKATLKESSVPAGIKGVRIFAEFNQMDGMLPEPKQKKPKEKKEQFRRYHSHRTYARGAKFVASGSFAAREQ